MKSITRKEIRKTVKASLTDVISKLEIADPSKKTNRLIKKIAGKMSEELKNDLRRQFKKAEKTAKPAKTEVNGRPSRKVASV